MTAPEALVEWVNDAILSLPQDLKAMLRIVEDPEIGDAGRVSAAGSLLHVLSAQNAIPGLRGILAVVDDVLVMRLILERLETTDPEAMAQHRQDSPELLEPLKEQMAVTREYLGNLMKVLEHAADGVAKLSHQGHTASQCVHDPEAGTWLYDAVHEAILELEFDEDDVVRETKRLDQIRAPLQARMTTLK